MMMMIRKSYLGVTISLRAEVTLHWDNKRVMNFQRLFINENLCETTLTRDKREVVWELSIFVKEVNHEKWSDFVENGVWNCNTFRSFGLFVSIRTRMSYRGIFLLISKWGLLIEYEISEPWYHFDVQHYDSKQWHILHVWLGHYCINQRREINRRLNFPLFHWTLEPDN